MWQDLPVSCYSSQHFAMRLMTLAVHLLSTARASWCHTGLGLVDRWEIFPVPMRPLCSCSTSGFVSSRTLCQAKVLQFFIFFLMTLRPVGLRKICQLRIWFLASKKSRKSIWMVLKSILALASARACPVHQASSFVTQRGDQIGVSLRPIPHFLKLNELLKGGSFTAQCFLFAAKKSKRMQ